jgi:hypothetical protein
MNHGRLLASFVGYAIGSGVVLLVGLRIKPWNKRAHRLAAASDIALPSLVEDKVARFLRSEMLYGYLILLPLLILFNSMTIGVRERRYWVQWYPWVMIALPAILISFAFVAALWPRWNPSGRVRMSHLSQSASPSQVFAGSEAITLIFGVAVTLASGFWGISRTGASVAWWTIWPIFVAAGIGAWWYMARVLMKFPARASNAIELGWNDVLRFRRVRALTIGAAWLPAIVLFLVDDLMASEMGNDQVFSTLPSSAVVVVLVIVALIFRQGRQRWRQTWISQ